MLYTNGSYFKQRYRWRQFQFHKQYRTTLLLNTFKKGQTYAHELQKNSTKTNFFGPPEIAQTYLQKLEYQKLDTSLIAIFNFLGFSKTEQHVSTTYKISNAMNNEKNPQHFTPLSAMNQQNNTSADQYQNEQPTGKEVFSPRQLSAILLPHFSGTSLARKQYETFISYQF